VWTRVAPAPICRLRSGGQGGLRSGGDAVPVRATFAPPGDGAEG
jgi:hypothetical protein